MKLHDAELKVMEVLWEHGDSATNFICAQLNLEVGWGNSTTNAIIKRCIHKKAITRDKVTSICHALVIKDQ